jgi:hypothetical protein
LTTTLSKTRINTSQEWENYREAWKTKIDKLFVYQHGSPQKFPCIVGTFVEHYLIFHIAFHSFVYLTKIEPGSSGRTKREK